MKVRDYPFLDVIVLIKWALLHTDDGDWKREATVQDVTDIVNLMEAFHNVSPVINFKTKEGLNKSMRVIAFQQSWSQDFIGKHVFQRQVQLYADAEQKDDIATEFKALTGFTLVDFISCCLNTYLYLSRDTLLGPEYVYDGIIHDEYYEFCESRYPQETLVKFISMLTLERISDVVPLQKLTNEIYQLYETNFLATKPFIKFEGYPRTAHKSIFGQTCQHFIYDFMKLKSETFPVKFGRKLERYVERGIQEMKLPYITETGLTTRWGESKVVDFMVNESVLIECKAIELHPRSAVSRDPAVISKELKGSIVKAYCQMLTVASKERGGKIWNGVVVTYKEMYLGLGSDAWEEFLKEPVQAFCFENGIDPVILPPDNLCFTDLEGWDSMVQAVCNGIGTIEKIIAKWAELNSQDHTKVLMLEQVIKKHFYFKQFKLSYLSEVGQII